MLILGIPVLSERVPRRRADKTRRPADRRDSMKLSQLLQAIGSQQTCADCEINQVTCDSRRVEKDSLFVCIKGLKFDGHDHAQKAI